MDDAPERKLTTILSADVAGYSRLMGADEPGTLARLKTYREAILEKVAAHRGRLVNTAGDSVLAEFASVVNAVDCAVRIQRDLVERNATLPEPRRMLVRIGVNLGDVMMDDGDLFGEGVNIAARLQELAEPGGMLVSGSVFEQVRNKLSLGFDFLGAQSVKNITEKRFIAEHFSEREVAAFQACAVPGLQANYLRTCAVLVLGGIYSDVDLRCLGSLQPLIGGDHAATFFVIPPRTEIQNDFFFVRSPGLPFLRCVLDVATLNIERRIEGLSYMIGGVGVFTALYWLLQGDTPEDVRRRLDGRHPKYVAQILPTIATAREVTQGRLPEIAAGLRFLPGKLGGYPPYSVAQGMAHHTTKMHWFNWEGSIYR